MTMDWLEQAVRDSAPRRLEADTSAREYAIAVARESARLQAATRPTRPRTKRIVAGMTLGLGVLGLGVGAAVAATPVIDWLGWNPDVVAQRSFELGDGAQLGLCEVYIRVTPEYGSLPNDEVDRRTEAARAFLTDHDWQSAVDSITAAEIQAEYERDQARREVRVTDTPPPPAKLSAAATTLIADRITEDFDRAGYLQPGVALEAAAQSCDDAPESSTQ